LDRRAVEGQFHALHAARRDLKIRHELRGACGRREADQRGEHPNGELRRKGQQAVGTRGLADDGIHQAGFGQMIEVGGPAAEHHDAHGRGTLAQRADERQAVGGRGQAQVGDHQLRVVAPERLQCSRRVQGRANLVAGLLEQQPAHLELILIVVHQ